jgi:hypothetical protein
MNHRAEAKVFEDGLGDAPLSPFLLEKEEGALESLSFTLRYRIFLYQRGAMRRPAQTSV